MKKRCNETRHIHRVYTITSAEIKEYLGIEGDIHSIVLLEGLSPEQEEQGVSPDTSKWQICTEEIK